jgi:hypothetical protein
MAKELVLLQTLAYATTNTLVLNVQYQYVMESWQATLLYALVTEHAYLRTTVIVPQDMKALSVKKQFATVSIRQMLQSVVDMEHVPLLTLAYVITNTKDISAIFQYV